MTKEYQEYLESPEWKEFRKKAFAHYGRKCDKCKRTNNLQIHHLHYDNIFHEKLEDVRVLCKKHHEETHGIKPPKKKVEQQNKQKNKKKEARRLRRLKRGIIAPKEQHRINVMHGPKRKVKEIPKSKPMKTKFPTVDAILQRKQERERFRMRVIE